MKRIILFLSILFVFSNIYAQNDEHIVKFQIKNKNELRKLPKYVSIDRVDGNLVIAYLPNDKAFDNFKKLYPNLIELPKPGEKITAKSMATTVDELTANWDKYPTYPVYVQYMQQIAEQYPTLCQLDTIGTSQEGRLLLSLKITDNLNHNEFKPQFFYTSTMHGDEVTGYMFLLRFINYLLSNYGKDQNVTYLINNYEIYINPLANPDGTYSGGDNTVAGAQRYYANDIDPNRNFEPQPGGFDPDDPGYCPETEAMKQFASEHHFVMSANLHGGAEVYNYPWDVWTSSEHPHPDDNWFQTVGQRFVDSARIYNSNYFNNPAPGVTEGGDWYVIHGGRQDYMNFAQHCKEVTLEVSNTKLPESSEMPTFYQYLLSPMFWYITETTNGIQGLVLDDQAHPLHRRIILDGHDVIADSSFVYSRPEDGVFFRPITPGTYTVLVQDLSGNTEYTQSVSVSNGRNFVLFAPGSLPNIDVHIKTTLIKTDQPVPNTEVAIIGMTNSFADTVTTDENGLIDVSLYPGVYKMITNLDGNPFQIVNYISVYNGMDSVYLEQFKFINAQIQLTDYFSAQPVENATVTLTYGNSSVSYTSNSSGLVNLSNLIGGENYQVSVQKIGYYNFDTSIVPVSDGQIFNLTLKPVINVQITVIDSNNLSPISDATVQLYKNSTLINSYTTNSDGTVTFSLPTFDTYQAKVTISGLEPIWLDLEPTSTLLTDTVYVKRAYARVTILDALTANPVSGAIVQYGDESVITGSDGIAIIPSANPQTIELNISASGYYGTTTQVTTSVDTSDFTVSLYPQVYYNFTVIDSVTNDPIWAASVTLTIDDNTHLNYLTNSDGFVQISWPSFDPYLVTFSKYNYVTKNITFDPAQGKTLEIDKTIALVPVSTAVEGQHSISIYPNPAAKLVNIAGANGYKLVIYDITGKAVMQARISSDVSTINISQLQPGSYIVKLTDGRDVKNLILIKR